MRLIGDIAEDAEVRAIASGAITDGAPVVVNADGTVAQVSGSSFSSAVGSEVTFESGATDMIGMTFDSNAGKVVIFYEDEGNSNYGTAVVGTVDSSDNSISFGTPVVFNSGATQRMAETFDSSNNKVVVAYRDQGNSSQGTAIVGTVSGTSISFGSEAVFNSGSTSKIGCTFDTSNNKVVIAYQDGGNSSYGTAVVGTVSGTSISFGSEVVFESAGTDLIRATFDSSSNKVVITYQDGGNNDYGTAIVGTVSGTSISFGSAVVFESGAISVDQGIDCTFDSTNNKVVIAFIDSGDSNKGKAVIGTVSSTSISFGTAVVFNNATTAEVRTTFDSNVGKAVVFYNDSGDTNRRHTFISGTVSGTSISFGSEVEARTTSDGSDLALTFDSTNNKVVCAFRHSGGTAVGKSIVHQVDGTSQNITSENFIGIANAAYADGQKATVKTTGSIARNIPQQPIASSAGTPVAFDSGRANETSIVYDPNVNRFFIAYKARDNSSYGTGVVATLSGTSLSFGTPVVFESAEAKGITPVFDTNTNKIVITYKDVGNSERGTAVVATIDSSDNSVTYGSPVVYHTSESSGSFRSAAFVPATVTNNDDSANSIVVAFKDGGDSGKGKAVVGVVSGVGNTSTTWGTVATFNSGSTDQDLTVVNDTNAKRLLIAYKDNGNSSYGTAVVATVNSSDSSITFGSETVFHSAETDELCGVFDPDTNKIILCFHDGADGNKSKSIVATISGTSVSFGSVVTVNTGGSYQNSVVYDTTANKAIVSMRDDTNARGISFTGTVSGTDISYDSGIVFQGSTGGALDMVASAFDPDTSKVAIVYNLTTGKGVVHSPLADGDLTIGQQYFVQTDGTLGTSADDPSVIAGTAISTSELIVKG